MNSEYVIKVAPLIRLPVSRTQVFSYLHEKPLEAGTLVAIPFYFREVSGIVLESEKYLPRYGSLKLKRIKKEIESALLTKNQIGLAQDISAYYLSPLGLTLKSMVPKRMKARLKKEKTGAASKKTAAANSPEVKKITKSASFEFLLEGSLEKRESVLLGLASQCVEEGSQCLVLAPEVYFSHGVFEWLKTKFPEEKMALIHGKTPKGYLCERWEKIKSGKVSIIVATKVGVFLPFRDLRMIVVKQEVDPSHKQSEMSPRYSAVKVVEFLSRRFGAKIVFDSSFYSVAVTDRFQKKKIEKIDLPDGKSDGMKIEIVDLAPEKKKADFPISEILYKHLARTINQKKKAILLVNRRGTSSHTVCRGCREVLRCPDCGQALAYFEKHEKYCCFHCSHKKDLLSACPRCGGFQFSHFGSGIEAVERKIRKMFPASRVERLDSDVMGSPKKYKKIHADFESGKINILLGTQIAARSAGLGKADLVGVISARDFFGLPDFNSREVALSHLFETKERVSEKGTLVVQSFDPRDALFGYLDSQDLSGFYEGEMKIRKKLSFPPEAKLVKITYRDKVAGKAEKRIKEVFDLLKSLGDNKIEISDSYSPVAAKRRGFCVKSLLIRLPPNADISKTPLYAAMARLGKGWAVDVDPETTI
jgi:primosomal protein N' (replication factor Y)